MQTRDLFLIRTIVIACAVGLVCSALLWQIAEATRQYQEREQANRFEFLDYTFFLQTGRLPPRSPRPAPTPEAPGPRGI